MLILRGVEKLLQCKLDLFDLNLSPKGKGKDKLGEFSIYLIKNQKVQLKIRRYLSFYRIEWTAKERINFPKQRKKSFRQTNFNLLLEPKLRNFLAYTYGLDDENHEYWPQVLLGNLNRESSIDHALNPIIFYKSGKALALAIFTKYLAAAVNLRDGLLRVGFNSAINQIKEGQSLSLVVVEGKTIQAALSKLGSLFLEGKKIKQSALDKLSYWNCYGAYYSDLFHPFTEKKIEQTLEKLKQRRIPIGWIGLDLWYHYRTPGIALDFEPDESKYPSGLGNIYEKYKIPFLLHLSALAKDNRYRIAPFYKDKKCSCPKSPILYERIKEQTANFSLGIWHDWLRTQQRLVSNLWKNETACEIWFDNMCKAFYPQPVMLCMPTTGFYFASGKQRNAVSIRTYNDYFFSQKPQVEKAKRKKQFPRKIRTESRESYLWNQVMLSALASTLHLIPFFDIFLTAKEDTEGFYENEPEKQALLRSLSNGIIGIGDRAEKVDKSIIDKICFGDGSLTKGGSELKFLESSLGKRFFCVYNQTNFSGIKYYYLAILNLRKGKRLTNLAERLAEETEINPKHFIIYNYFSQAICGGIKAKEGYYILAPEFNGFAFIGFVDKYITMPQNLIRRVEFGPKQCELSVNSFNGKKRLLIYSERDLKEVKGAELIGKKAHLYLFEARANQMRFRF